ncbi:hypothetical protein ANH9776_08375 [Aggregatibacter actinomycetemcomitans serotype e str. ANH9776]|nr:hypothetical protein ANH9776_08375 [Aggregatibacter actinomycetemcomitans serotype e str. ANH9776]
MPAIDKMTFLPLFAEEGVRRAEEGPLRLRQPPVNGEAKTFDCAI